MSSNQFDESSFTRPEHHVHPSSEPLPGARGAAPTADYSPTTIERTPSSAFDPNNIDHAATSHNMERTGENAFNTERPLNVEPAPQGGVAVGGDEGAELPMGKASMGDKIIGKTQKLVGKYTHKPELHEKGELREAGGKSAVMGETRAPHD